MPYSPTAWNDDAPPALSAANLGKLRNELVSQAGLVGVPHSLPVMQDGATDINDPAVLNEFERVTKQVAADLSLSYTVTAWSVDTPDRDANALNKLEAQAQANRAALDGTTSNPLFFMDFEDGTGSQGAAAFPKLPSVDNLNCISLDRIQRVGAQNGVTPFQGGFMCRFEHRSGDPEWLNSGFRAEINTGQNVAAQLGGGSLEGKTWWMGWRCYVHTWSYASFTTMGQLHGGNDNICGVDVLAGGTGKVVYHVDPAPGVYGREVTLADSLPVGQWFEIKCGFHPFSTSSGGRSSVYFNGVLKGSSALDGQNLFTGLTTAPFPKFGIYRGGNSGTILVYYDNFRCAATFEELG